MKQHFRLSDWETDVVFSGLKNPYNDDPSRVYFNAARELLFLGILKTNHRYWNCGNEEEQGIKIQLRSYIEYT